MPVELRRSSTTSSIPSSPRRLLLQAFRRSGRSERLAWPPVPALAAYALALLFGECSLASAGEAGSLPSAASFRYTNAAAVQCVGTRLTSRWTITAAHCLRGGEAALALQCPADGEGRVETLRVLQVVTHPTHDVALIEFSEPLACFGEAARVARAIEHDASFFSLMLPKESLASASVRQEFARAPLTELSRDGHTLKLYDDVACLAEGDSGSPVFAAGDVSPAPLVGVLISGLPGCPTTQTAVRTDRLYEWLVEHTGAKVSARSGRE
jgi:hypothetical protein